MDFSTLSLEQLQAEKTTTQAALHEYETYLSQVLAELADYVSEMRQTSYLIADAGGWQYIIASHEQVTGYYDYLGQLVSLLVTINEHIRRIQ